MPTRASRNRVSTHAAAPVPPNTTVSTAAPSTSSTTPTSTTAVASSTVAVPAAENAATEANDPQQRKVITVENKAEFDKILAESGKKIVLVEFYAQWCGPCKLIGLKLEELANLYADKIVIVKIDVDNMEEVAIQYDVTSMPTFVFLKNKLKVEQFAGSNSEKVETAVKKHCTSKL